MSAAGDPELGVIQAFIDALNARDVDGCLALMREDVVMATAPEWPGGGTYVGHTEVRRFLDQFLEPWESIRYEHSDPERMNGRIVERGRWVGRGRTSGIESAVDFHLVWAVSGGKVARMNAFGLREQALAFARSASSSASS